VTRVKYKYLGVRGYDGYVHAECWPTFVIEHSRYNAQGQQVSRPTYDSQLQTFRGIRQYPCLQCGRPLLAKPPEKVTAGWVREDGRRLTFSNRKVGLCS